mmetsp:Transcript_5239/g.13794  ORF Transcript_5239/g.13794 Transcript_5239/m.13794 type:complete len:113 (+) Transcript_5239:197-535(+)
MMPRQLPTNEIHEVAGPTQVARAFTVHHARKQQAPAKPSHVGPVDVLKRNLKIGISSNTMPAIPQASACIELRAASTATLQESDRGRASWNTPMAMNMIACEDQACRAHSES